MKLSKEELFNLNKGDRVVCVSDCIHKGQIFEITYKRDERITLIGTSYCGCKALIPVLRNNDDILEFELCEGYEDGVDNIRLSAEAAYEAYNADNKRCGVDSEEGEEFITGYLYGKTVFNDCATRAMSRVRDLFYSNGFNPAEDYDAKFSEYLCDEMKSSGIIKYAIDILLNGKEKCDKDCSEVN